MSYFFGKHPPLAVHYQSFFFGEKPGFSGSVNFLIAGVFMILTGHNNSHIAMKKITKKIVEYCLLLCAVTRLPGAILTD